MAADTSKALRQQVMYCVYVRQYSKEGTFEKVREDLARIRDLGVDILWLLPIHPIGKACRKGALGSPYAIRDYRADRQTSFRGFAELCVTRQIITAIKTATRQKHVPLNSYVSLNKPIYDEESDRTLMDVIVEGRAQNPEELIIGRENLVSFRDQVDRVLSGLEQDVLNAYLDGKSYQEIADKLGRHVKSIDNALQRVKRKMEKFLEESKAQDD